MKDGTISRSRRCFFICGTLLAFSPPTEGRSLITQQLLAKTWKSQHLVLYFLAKVGFGYGSEVSIVDSGVDCSSRPRPRGAVPLCTIQYSILYTIHCI